MLRIYANANLIQIRIRYKYKIEFLKTFTKAGIPSYFLFFFTWYHVLIYLMLPLV